MPTSRYSNRRYLTGCRPTTPPAQTLDCTRQGTCRGGFCPPACPRRGLLALTQPHERVGTFHQTGVRGRRLSKLPTPGVAPAGPRRSWGSRKVVEVLTQALACSATAILPRRVASTDLPAPYARNREVNFFYIKSARRLNQWVLRCLHHFYGHVGWYRAAKETPQGGGASRSYGPKAHFGSPFDTV